MTLPLIGITPRTAKNEAPTLWGVQASYAESVAAAGGAPLFFSLVDNEAAIRRIYESVDGVLLTGGRDVDPSYYGEELHPTTKVDEPRDRVELMLTRWCVEDKKPLLAICRGIQVLNVALGGSLYQDLPSQHPSKVEHNVDGPPCDQPSHEIKAAPGSLLTKIFNSETIPVNTAHHQAIKTLAPGLRPTASSSDGIIEAVEGTGPNFLIGIQCHPELLWQKHDPRWLELFKKFVEAAKK